MDEKDIKIAYLEKIIALMPGNVYWKDRSGKYLGCNQNNAATVGVASPADVIGKTLHELADRKYADPVVQVDNDIMAKDQERTLEEQAYDAAGNPAIYLTRKVPLHDDDGNVVGLVGISFDITERKQLEEEHKIALEHSKNEEIFSLRNIIALMPGSVYWKDREGRLLGCNNNMAKMMQLNSPEEVYGKDDIELIGPELAVRIREIDNEVMSKDKPYWVEEKGENEMGEPAVYWTQKIPLHNREGKVVGLLGLSMDITDRKKMEEDLRAEKEKAEAANRAKTQFLSVASHELRTPLSGILGMARFLQEGSLTPEEEKEYIESIVDAANYQLSIVNSILDFSKLEAGKFSLNPAPLDLKILVEEVAGMLIAPAKNKNLDLLVDYEVTAPHNIIGDRCALRQVLTNLVGNAIKFTEQGHVVIKVRCSQQTARIAQFEIIVEDTGVGIAADKHDAIFEKFHQISDAYIRDSSRAGTGLGLSIVKKLVELMNGEIRVESELGKGSIFYCTLEFLKINKE